MAPEIFALSNLKKQKITVYGFFQKETGPLVLLEILMVQTRESSALCCFSNPSWITLFLLETTLVPLLGLFLEGGSGFAKFWHKGPNPPKALIFAARSTVWVHGIFLALATPVRGWEV